MSNSIYLTQGVDTIVQTKRTVDWLVKQTEVAVFDPISFDGYQRQIDQKHCRSIVKYLLDNEYMPSSIICACDGDYSEDKTLRVVDGQHRIEAFKILRNEYPERYFQLKDCEIALNVLLNPDKEKEISVFININKKTKKVDTSLAYVLRSKLTKAGEDAMSRAEYLAVEVACKLNETGVCDYWTNRILFEGNLRSSECYISLNAFVRATRVFINLLEKSEIIRFHWYSREELAGQIQTITNIIVNMWHSIYQRWPEMCNAPLEDKQVLQGSIGYTAILRSIVKVLRQHDFSTIADAERIIDDTIMSFNIPSSNWRKNGYYANYSSETGYKIVSEDLLRSFMK